MPNAAHVPMRGSRPLSHDSAVRIGCPSRAAVVTAVTWTSPDAAARRFSSPAIRQQPIPSVGYHRIATGSMTRSTRLSPVARTLYFGGTHETSHMVRLYCHDPG